MGQHILVIEDDADVRETLKDVLEMQGFEVTTACHGGEGIEALEKTIPNVILLDLMMPQVNGWQFLDLQRNDPRFNEIPVIICSAYTESAKAIKPAGVIPKPIKLNHLLWTLKALPA